MEASHLASGLWLRLQAPESGFPSLFLVLAESIASDHAANFGPGSPADVSEQRGHIAGVLY